MTIFGELLNRCHSTESYSDLSDWQKKKISQDEYNDMKNIIKEIYDEMILNKLSHDLDMSKVKYDKDYDEGIGAIDIPYKVIDDWGINNNVVVKQIEKIAKSIDQYCMDDNDDKPILAIDDDEDNEIIRIGYWW